MANKQGDSKQVNENANVESKPLTEKDKELLKYFNENIGDASTQIVDHTENKENFLEEVTTIVREVEEKARKHKQLARRKAITEMILNANNNENAANAQTETKENDVKQEQEKQPEPAPVNEPVKAETKIEVENTKTEVADKSADEKVKTLAKNETADNEDNIVYDKVYTEYRVANDDPVPEMPVEPETKAVVEAEKSVETETEAKQPSEKKESKLGLFKLGSKQKENKSADKKNSDKGYKPPFYQTFKFWAIIVASVCIVAFLGFIIYTSIKNAAPKLPTGIVFEANQGLEGFVPQTDTLVLSPNSSTGSLQVKVKFKNNFSGTIKLSLSIRVATLSTDTVRSGDTVIITPLHSVEWDESSEIIGGKTQLKAEYQTVHAELEILIDKQMTEINLSSSYDVQDAKDLTNKIGQVGFDSKMSSNSFYVDRPVYLTAVPRYGFITEGSPNGDDFDREIIWESNRPDIATVDSTTGRVTSYKSGRVRFTARAKVFYLDQAYSMVKNIYLNFEDVPVYSVKLKNNMDNVTLWLSDTPTEINVRDYIDIIPNTQSVPTSFTANYLYNNAELLCLESDSVSKSLVINGVANKPSYFTLYNSTTEAETREGVKPINLTVRFGTATALWLDNYGGSKIAVTVKRNKNLMLTLPENASNKVQIQNIAFYKGEGTEAELEQSYSRVDLQSLFNLNVIDNESTVNSGADAKGNNFDPARDIVYKKFNESDDRFSIDFDSATNKYYFVPNMDVLTAAMDYGQGFRIVAYLKDINKANSQLTDENGGYAVIEHTSTETSNTTLFVEVVSPSNVTLDARIQPIEISKSAQTEDIFKTIYDSFNSLRLSIQNNNATAFVNVSKENLLSATSAENKTMPKYKAYIELSRQNDRDIYINDKTVVGINNSAAINSEHTITVKFMYVYNIIPSTTLSSENSNVVELATLDIKIKVVA